MAGSEGKSESKALSVIADRYPMLSSDTDESIAIIRDNLGDGLSVMDFTKISVPLGGSTTWMVPTLDGEEAQKELRGVVLARQTSRAYWSDPIPSGNAPDCSSRNGDMGVSATMWEATGGKQSCFTCPLAQPGSKEGSKFGQACRTTAHVMLLQPKSSIPDDVALPPTSLTNLRKYMTMLVRGGLRYTDIETVITLEKVTARGTGFTYSVANFSSGDRLSGPEIAAAREAAEVINGLLSQGPTNIADQYPADYNAEDSSPSAGDIPF